MTTTTKQKLIRADQSLYDGVTFQTSRKDSTGGTLAGLKINDFVDVLQIYGNGTDYTVSTIDKATSTIRSANVTLRFNPGTWVIDQNLTIASNFTSYIPAGCVFNVSSGKTLTFNGPIIRESETWTSGSGTVSYTADNNTLVHTADIGAVGIRRVATISALKALSAPATSYVVHIDGYYAAGDSGGGLFRWNSSDTSTDDGGLVIRPNSAPTTGRWNRLYTDHFIFEWFGGVINDSNTDNTSFLNNIAAACRTTGIRKVRFAKHGYYYFNTQPTKFGFGIQLEGASPRSFLVRNYNGSSTYYTVSSTTANLISNSFLCWDGSDYTTVGSDANLTKGECLKNIGLYAGASTTGGIAMSFTGADTNNRGGYGNVENVVVTSASGEFDAGIVIDGSVITTSGSQGVRDMNFSNVYLFRCRRENLRVKNGVHIAFELLSIDDGGLGVTPQIRINGAGTSTSNSESVHITAADLYGDVNLDQCSDVHITGRASGVAATSNVTNSTFTGYAAGTVSNDSPSMMVYLGDRITPPNTFISRTASGGYVPMFGKLTMQFGDIPSTSASSDVTITYPVAFSTAVLQVWCATNGTAATTEFKVNGTPTTTQAVFRNSSGGTAQTGRWFALGY